MPLHPSNPMANVTAPAHIPDPSVQDRPYSQGHRYRSHPHQVPQHPQTQPQHHAQQPPPFSLSDNDVALLSQTCADFFAQLRSNQFACEWIFPWVLSSAPSHIDASGLNLSLSRGYRTACMCGSRGCASLESQTLLQKNSTLLLPVQSRDNVVVGYYVESSSDQVSPEMVRMGKYVYCSTSRELIKVSKVRGPPSASRLLSVCVKRTNHVGNGMFIKDFVMVSFPWQSVATSVPNQCVVHSRTLAFHKLLQTAQQAGLTGHVSDGVHGSSGPQGDMGVPENSFYGLGTFGVYESVLVPSRLCAGMRAESGDLPPLSVGNWAIPEHYAFCRGHRVLHMGMFREEIASLRSQFVQAYGHTPPVPSRLPADPPPSYDERRQGTHSRAQPHQQNLQPDMPRSGQTTRSAPLGTYSQQHHAGYASRATTDFDYDKTASHHPAIVRSNSAPTPLNPPLQHSSGPVLVDDSNTSRELTVDSVAATSSLPPEISTSVMLPIQRQIAVAAGQAFQAPVDPALDVVVESIEAVVAGQKPSTTGAKKGGINIPTSQTTQAATLPSTPKTSNENKPPTKTSPESTFSLPTFKKTLPAPTKSEIVIRNRISAQRSNEKRRRKIEATKAELAYLRTTYLPQLETRQGSLISENQSLRLKFMEKYHESDLDSFF